MVELALFSGIKRRSAPLLVFWLTYALFLVVFPFAEWLALACRSGDALRLLEALVCLAFHCLCSFIVLGVLRAMLSRPRTGPNREMMVMTGPEDDLEEVGEGDDEEVARKSRESGQVQSAS